MARSQKCCYDVSYPALKDEAYSVQLGFSPPASSGGSGAHLSAIPLHLIKAWAMFMLALRYL